MSDPPAPAKKAARTFDLQAMLEQARLGAQERTNVDWTSEIEKAKEENESRIVEMKLRSQEAAKKITNSAPANDAVDEDDDFGPSIDLATAPTAEDENTSDEDEEDPNAPLVSKNYLSVNPVKVIKQYVNKNA